MKIESRVTLSREELEIINKAFEILDDFHTKAFTVDDPNITLRDNAFTARDAIDNFLCEYAEVYE